MGLDRGGQVSDTMYVVSHKGGDVQLSFHATVVAMSSLSISL
jgi:hypothetical protein